MCLKRDIPELCPQCGQKQARQEPDGRVVVSHVCPLGPPGPPDPPKCFRPGEVNFIPASEANA